MSLSGRTKETPSAPGEAAACDWAPSRLSRSRSAPRSLPAAPAGWGRCPPAPRRVAGQFGSLPAFAPASAREASEAREARAARRGRRSRDPLREAPRPRLPRPLAGAVRTPFSELCREGNVFLSIKKKIIFFCCQVRSDIDQGWKSVWCRIESLVNPSRFVSFDSSALNLSLPQRSARRELSALIPSSSPLPSAGVILIGRCDVLSPEAHQGLHPGPHRFSSKSGGPASLHRPWALWAQLEVWVLLGHVDSHLYL